MLRGSFADSDPDIQGAMRKFKTTSTASSTKSKRSAGGVGYTFYMGIIVVTGLWILFLYRHSMLNSSASMAALEEMKLGSKEAILSLDPLDIPSIPFASKIDSDKTSATGDHFHIVFSTDCTPYQDWQSLLVFHSAFIVGQKGSITRIASGCNEEKQVEITELYKKLWGSIYNAHFTPDFKKTSDGKKYDFYNKPYGLKHWLENTQLPSNTVIALIDPDFIFLRPLTLKLAGEENNIFYKEETPENVPKLIGKGQPVAQLYGLGAPWAAGKTKNFDRDSICPAGSPCLQTKVSYGERHFSVGPPYLVHIEDMKRLTDSWVEFVPKVYESYPELLAEMYAYSIAAAHQELPHITMQHHMVSNIDMSDEGWKWIDALGDDVCEPPLDGEYYPGKPMPTFLHYCQFFRVGEIGFQKRRVKDIFSCEKPMMLELPKDLGTMNYKNRDGQRIPLNKRDARRGAFMLCIIHQAINAAAQDYKNKMCDSSAANYEKSLNLAGNTPEALRALGF